MTTSNQRKKPKTAPNNWKPHDQKNEKGELKSWIFISNAIDTYGLDAIEFRILAHIARREGRDGAFPALETMSNDCGISKRRISKALKVLCNAGILRKQLTGRSNKYFLEKDSSRWVHPSKLNDIRNK